VERYRPQTGQSVVPDSSPVRAAAISAFLARYSIAPGSR
jgi:hypothetical protein